MTVKGSMRYLGVMRGSGSLACLGQPRGRADYEIDGFQTPPGEIVRLGRNPHGAGASQPGIWPARSAA